MIDVADWKQVSARPPTDLGSFGATASQTVTQNFALPPDTQALFVQLVNPLAQYAHLKVTFHPTAGSVLYVPLELFSFQQQIYVVPITPRAMDTSAAQNTTIDVTLQATAAGTAFIDIQVLYEANPLWLEVFPLPQAAPNQFPKTAILTLAALTAQWIIQSVANVQITLFNIVVMRYNPSVANDDFVIGYNPTLPANGVQPPNAQVLIDSTQTAASGAGPMFTIPLAGVQLPRGSGLYADTSLSAIANLWLLVEYSLG